MLNYSLMKPTLRNLYGIILLCLLFAAACSAPNNGNTANTNTPPPVANLNTTPPIAEQPSTPMVSNAAPSNPQPVTPTPATPQPVTPPTVSQKPAEPISPPAANANAPKLVVLSSDKDLDFGQQPQDKTLTRVIQIKNGGRQPLNIESVVPS
jgi:hypothetical protein